MRKVLVPLLLSGALALPAAARADDEAERFIGLMSQYLDLSEQVVSIASSPENAMHLAIAGIVEIYEKRGEKAKAVAPLEEILRGYPDNQTVRNLVRFKLNDIYKETGRTDLALEQLKLVAEENR
jgi:tetratricopeptide (TPR) repeat protein